MVRNQQQPNAESFGWNGSSRAGHNPLHQRFAQAIAHAAIAGCTGHGSCIGNPSHDPDRPLFGRLYSAGLVPVRRPPAPLPAGEQVSLRRTYQPPGASMTPLLQMAIEAHGGLKRWSEVRTIIASASITGAIWAIKGQTDYLNNIIMRVDTQQQRIVTDFPTQDKRLTYEPGRVTLEMPTGRISQERKEPEASFAGQSLDTPWDPLHVAYFQGEALWTYLNTPFLYAQPDFVTEEISSIEVEEERWRRLKVIFPDHIKSHTKTQVSCFGADGLLRRHDYTVDILGGATGLNYAYDYQEVDGLQFFTKRRVYAYEGDYVLVPEPLLVNIDVSRITLERT
jgi:hypothetical protein